MTHPEDQLAPYVDGSLAASERSAVESHVATCARCAEEVALARTARGALRVARDIEVPTVVGATAVAEARRDAPPAGGSSAGGPAGWSRWLAGAAAAAAVVLALVLVVPNLGGSGGDAATEAGGAAGSSDAAAGVGATDLERIAGDVAQDDLLDLAESGRSLAPTALAGEGAAPAEDGAGPAPQATGAADAGDAMRTGQADRAATCLRTAFPSITGEPLRLLTLRFEGVPAFAGVYAEPADADTPADTLQVVVADRRGCGVLATAVVRI